MSNEQSDDKYEGSFKYRMLLKFDGFERVVEGEYPARPEASPSARVENDVPLCGGCAQEWFTGRNTLPDCDSPERSSYVDGGSRG